MEAQNPRLPLFPLEQMPFTNEVKRVLRNNQKAKFLWKVLAYKLHEKVTSRRSTVSGQLWRSTHVLGETEPTIINLIQFPSLSQPPSSEYIKHGALYIYYAVLESLQWLTVNFWLDLLPMLLLSYYTWDSKISLRPSIKLTTIASARGQKIICSENNPT